ncbi:hypothetical protein RJT34_19675 [Clitoria ternatea]|uniref:Uncharacterized protein n=1 Tax=Clitoria ternatea TaxID=43366 RepID=A0AAN9IRQ6_CLITE
MSWGHLCPLVQEPSIFPDSGRETIIDILLDLNFYTFQLPGSVCTINHILTYLHILLCRKTLKHTFQSFKSWPLEISREDEKRR